MVALFVQGDRGGGQRDLLHVRPRQVVSSALSDGGREGRGERGRFLSLRAALPYNGDTVHAAPRYNSERVYVKLWDVVFEIDGRQGARGYAKHTRGGRGVLLGAYSLVTH